MKLRVLMLSHRRAEYTRLSLRRLCETLPEYSSVTVWDNNSGPEMKRVLESFQNHPRIEKIVYNQVNEKLRGPTNQFWLEAGDAEFLGKVDDDCLVSPGWCETLIAAHNDIPKAGVLGSWHFPEEDFAPNLAARKIQTFGTHKIMRNCWVGGSGYLMKGELVKAVGPLRESESFTGWCIRAAAAGYINGWYYPFILQEHMDDPRSPHSGIATEDDFQRLRPLSAGTFNLKTRDEWIRWIRRDAHNQQRCSFDVSHYTGWKAALRRRVSRLMRCDLTPLA